ncbi:MAG: ferrous iron transport protein A [Chlorobium limicola]|jgi:ferrous iron transport protein A|nr:FeoA family protein [Chlorobium limicola]NTV08045.1 ferrous iron transport protein A [Chlorobium limicola]NTV20661.1 ferrous iron transport protein A [Chlorobium limicola]
MKMSELQVGDKAEVTAVKAEQAVRRRILDMGLIKGTRFKVLRVAPFGDPMEIFFKGMYLSLRKAEAEGISVHKTGHAGDGVPMSCDKDGLSCCGGAK